MNTEFEQRLSRYWELAHAEGYTGVSRGDEANEVLHRLREMHKASTVPEGWPECEEFYNLMQAYRHAPTFDLGATAAAYEAVKDWLAAESSKA